MTTIQGPGAKFEIGGASGSDSAAMDPGFMLTPEALLGYLRTKLQGLDNEIGSRLNDQNAQNAQQKILNDLSEALQPYASGTKDPQAIASMQQAYADAILHAGGENTPLGAKLKGQQDALNGTAGDHDIDSNEMNGYINALREMHDTIHETSEIAMTQLQSLVSERQQAIQLVTNMINTANDSLKTIASNVGRG